MADGSATRLASASPPPMDTRSGIARLLARTPAWLLSIGPGRLELLLALVVGLPVLMHLGSLMGRTSEPHFLEGDYAIEEMAAIQASRGVRLVGMVSRFGWHHPGPLYFYLLAPFRAMVPSSGFAILLGGWCIVTAALIIVLWVVYRSGTRFWFLAVLFALSRYVYACPDKFLCLERESFAWTPYVTILPFCALLFVLADIPRRPWLLVVAAALATFAVQTHVGYLPAAVAACSLSVVLMGASWWRQRRAGPPPSGEKSRYGFWMLCAGLTVVLLWTPPVVEEFHGAPGNLSRLVAFFQEEPESKHPMSSAVLVLRRQAADAVYALTGDRLRPISLRRGLVMELTLLCVGMLISILCRQTYLARLQALCLVGLLAAGYSIMSIRGDVLPYLVAWMQPVHYIAWTTTVYAMVAGLVPKLFDERARRLARPVGTVAVLALFAGYAIVVAGGHMDVATRPEPYPSSVLRERFTTALGGLMAQRRDASFAIEISQDNWPEGAAVTAALLEASVPFVLSDPWKGLVESTFERQPSPTHLLRIQVGPDDPRTGFSTFVRYGKHFVIVREVNVQ